MWNGSSSSVTERRLKAADLSENVLSAAVLVYLLPLGLFVAGYLAATALGWPAGLTGGGCFVLGLLPAFAYNRRVRKHPPRQTITGRVR